MNTWYETNSPRPTCLENVPDIWLSDDPELPNIRPTHSGAGSDADDETRATTTTMPAPTQAHTLKPQSLYVPGASSASQSNMPVRAFDIPSAFQLHSPHYQMPSYLFYILGACVVVAFLLGIFLKDVYHLYLSAANIGKIHPHHQQHQQQQQQGIKTLELPEADTALRILSAPSSPASNYHKPMMHSGHAHAHMSPVAQSMLTTTPHSASHKGTAKRRTSLGQTQQQHAQQQGHLHTVHAHDCSTPAQGYTPHHAWQTRLAAAQAQAQAQAHAQQQHQQHAVGHKHHRPFITHLPASPMISPSPSP